MSKKKEEFRYDGRVKNWTPTSGCEFLFDGPPMLYTHLACGKQRQHSSTYIMLYGPYCTECQVMFVFEGCLDE